MLAICASGWVNERTYWMKAWMSPTVMARRAARYPPSTAITTYDTLPTKPMIGIIRPDRNCDFHAEAYRTSLNPSNRATLAASALNALATRCPPYISSTCPLTCPRYSCCS